MAPCEVKLEQDRRGPGTAGQSVSDRLNPAGLAQPFRNVIRVNSLTRSAMAVSTGSRSIELAP